MKNNFELQASNQEVLSKEELLQKLELCYEKKNALLGKEANYYDKDNLQKYGNVRTHFRGNEERVALYLNVKKEAGGYQEMVDNYEKFKDFRENKLKPLEKDIREIESQLRVIRKQQMEDEQVVKDIELENKFDKDKDELATQLYEALDKIHSKIPSIAKELGMSTKVAIETYLPELSSSNRSLEHFIEEVENAESFSDLYSIRSDMERWDIKL